MRFLDLYAYFDYRLFLADYYQARKAADRHFSYRSFAIKAGLSSHTVYPSILAGKVGITPLVLPGFIKGLSLDEKEARYFGHMVEFTHAQTARAKQQIFQAMIAFLPRQEKRLAASQREYYAEWFHVAVHQALAALDVADDFQELAAFLDPPIRPSQAKRAIQILSELDLARKDERGFWRAVHGTVVGGGREIPVFAIHEFQRSMMGLASESLSRHTKEERCVITTTMSVSAQGRERIVERIRAFQKEIAALVASDQGEDRIYQLNLQLFPLSRSRS